MFLVLPSAYSWLKSTELGAQEYNHGLYPTLAIIVIGPLILLDMTKPIDFNGFTPSSTLLETTLSMACFQRTTPIRTTDGQLLFFLRHLLSPRHGKLPPSLLLDWRQTIPFLKKLEVVWQRLPSSSCSCCTDTLLFSHYCFWPNRFV